MTFLYFLFLSAGNKNKNHSTYFKPQLLLFVNKVGYLSILINCCWNRSNSSLPVAIGAKHRKSMVVFASCAACTPSRIGHGVWRGVKSFSCSTASFIFPRIRASNFSSTPWLKSVFVQRAGGREITQRATLVSPPLTFGPDAATEHCFSIRFSASSGAHMCGSLALGCGNCAPTWRSHTHFFSHLHSTLWQLNFNADYLLFLFSLKNLLNFKLTKRKTILIEEDESDFTLNNCFVGGV